MFEWCMNGVWVMQVMYEWCMMMYEWRMGMYAWCVWCVWCLCGVCVCGVWCPFYSTKRKSSFLFFCEISHLSQLMIQNSMINSCILVATTGYPNRQNASKTCSLTVGKKIARLKKMEKMEKGILRGLPHTQFLVWQQHKLWFLAKLIRCARVGRGRGVSPEKPRSFASTPKNFVQRFAKFRFFWVRRPLRRIDGFNWHNFYFNDKLSTQIQTETASKRSLTVGQSVCFGGSSSEDFAPSSSHHTPTFFKKSSFRKNHTNNWTPSHFASFGPKGTQWRVHSTHRSRNLV